MKISKLLGFGTSYTFKVGEPIVNTSGWYTYPVKYLGYGYLTWLGINLFKIKTKLTYGKMD
jgi:threonine/homoserine/homoserine lactone efflux protein